MDRTEYLWALDQALAERVPAQERADILRYYQEYFDEAGPEGEAAVIAELGDPRALAQRLAEEGGYGQSAAAPRRRSHTLVVVIAAVLVAAAALLGIGGLLFSRTPQGTDRNPPALDGGTNASQDTGVSQNPGASQNTSSAGDGFSSIRGEQFSKVDVEVGLADVTLLTRPGVEQRQRLFHERCRPEWRSEDHQFPEKSQWLLQQRRQGGDHGAPRRDAPGDRCGGWSG